MYSRKNRDKPVRLGLSAGLTKVCRIKGTFTGFMQLCLDGPGDLKHFRGHHLEPYLPLSLLRHMCLPATSTVLGSLRRFHLNYVFSHRTSAQGPNHWTSAQGVNKIMMIGYRQLNLTLLDLGIIVRSILCLHVSGNFAAHPIFFDFCHFFGSSHASGSHRPFGQ